MDVADSKERTSRTRKSTRGNGTFVGTAIGNQSVTSRDRRENRLGEIHPEENRESVYRLGESERERKRERIGDVRIVGEKKDKNRRYWEFADQYVPLSPTDRPTIRFHHM